MSTTFPIDELLALPPDDLAELLAAAAPGELPEVQAATLGLDLEIPEHRAAMRAALQGCTDCLVPHTSTEPCAPIGGQVIPDPPVSAGQEGVRSDLTPNPTAVPAPHEDQGGDVDEPTAPLNAADIAALLAEYRGKMEPVLAGTVAMYSARNGDVVIVFQHPDGTIQNGTIPAKLIRLALGMMSGRGGMLRRLMGG